jgi:perosamine synthetase
VGQAVLVPAMTFAATAEIVQYQGAIPILVDCDPITLNMDMEDAERKLKEFHNSQRFTRQRVKITGVIPVHVGGMMMDMAEVAAFARRHNLWVVADAAHAFPAAYRQGPEHRWVRCGENNAAVTCFSFYANKTMTTGEGGMAVTDDPELAEHMRRMSLHGLSNDAWKRNTGQNKWDYRILAPGYKYNMTDIAAALGIGQLKRSEKMRRQRAEIADYYQQSLDNLGAIELPRVCSDRIHAWHLFPVRLRLERLTVARNDFLSTLRSHGVGCSVHWRPLHLHPHYQKTYGWQPAQLPNATRVWKRLISLPIFPGMRLEEREHVVRVVRETCARYAIAETTRVNGWPKPR